MHSRITAAVIGIALIGTPAVAQAKQDTGAPGYATAIKAGLEDGNYKPYENQYLRSYKKFADEFGVQEAGRNVVLFGALLKDGVQKAGRDRVVADTEQFKAALNPAPVVETTEATTTTTYSSGAASGTVMCESGGDYSANTGNGYFGGYQFDSGTWDAYGDPQYAEASDAPPAAQDAAAASVPYDAWPNCP